MQKRPVDRFTNKRDEPNILGQMESLVFGKEELHYLGKKDPI